MKLKLSIRHKLEILVSILLAVISIFIYLYFPGKIEKVEMESLSEHGRSIGEITAYSVSSALFFNDLESARESLQSLESNTDIIYAVVTDETGSPFVSVVIDSVDRSTLNPEIMYQFVNENLLQIATPVTSSGNTIGYVFLGFSLDGIRHSIQESRAAIAGISIVIFILGIFVTMVISTVITTPLHKMVNTVRKIDNGDLTQRAPTGSGDEIDELAQSFNHMVQSLEISYDQLDGLNKNLEDRVQERTMQLHVEIENRKKAEAEMLLAKTYAERVVELTPIAIFSIDKNQQITSWNKKAAEITGYSFEYVYGKKCTEIVLGTCAGQCDLLKGDAKPINAKECAIHRKDGQEIIISKYVDSLRDDHGNIIGGIECFEDITYRKRLEEELQVRQRMDSLGNLAGGIAHDFNNLLMGIMGNLDMLRMEEDTLDNEQKDYVEESYKLSHRAAKLIKDIQSLTNESLMQQDDFDLYTTASDVFGILDRTTDKLIEKRIDIPPDTFIVYGNEDQIHQVLLNLGTNAANALVERGIKEGDYIRVSAKEEVVDKFNATGLPKGEYVHISFQDNGIGMTESVRKQAFDPLFTTRRKSAKKGQGLGLAMVYNIVTKNHNGNITIDSKKGKGTTINIWLEKGHNVAEKEMTMGNISQNGSGTILIVEDEAPIRKLTKKALEKSGYTVLTAEDGLHGLQQYKDHADIIELVILDLTMPKMSGSELFSQIREISPEVGIVIASGQSGDKLLEYNKLDGVLMKPYGIQTLVSIVNNAMETSAVLNEIEEADG